MGLDKCMPVQLFIQICNSQLWTKHHANIHLSFAPPKCHETRPYLVYVHDPNHFCLVLNYSQGPSPPPAPGYLLHHSSSPSPTNGSHSARRKGYPIFLGRIKDPIQTIFYEIYNSMTATQHEVEYNRSLSSPVNGIIHHSSYIYVR